MKKSDRLGLSIRGKILKFAAWYLTAILSVQLTGSIQNLLNHKEVKQYKEVVRDFGEFLDNKGIDDPIQVFDYYNYALWGGYLSKDHNFQFNIDRELFFSSFGLGCVLGDSVCLNNAAMLSDLYEEMGMDAGVIVCYVPIGKTRIDAIRGQGSITRKVADKLESNRDSSNMPVVVDPITLLFGNHAVTSVSSNGEIYYFDPTNLAYLFKSDIDNLDIINGEGAFKRRNFVTLLFELDTAVKGLFETNEEDYDLEYLNTYEETDIDIEKLEEFYNSEKELIDGIYDSLKSKPQGMLKTISICLAAILMGNGIPEIEKIIKRKRRKNGNKLKELISLFLLENGITKFEEVCSYVYYLIKLGYLSYDEENLKIKKSVWFESPDFVTFDKDQYGMQFFYEYINSKFDKVEVIKAREEEYGFLDTFFVYRDTDGYKFYSFRNNVICEINDAYQLVNSNGEYKIVKLKRKKYLESAPVGDVDVSFTKMDQFSEENKDKIEEIAKAYTYVPKK